MRSKLIEILGIQNADAPGRFTQFGKKNFILRSEYFWTPPYPPERFFSSKLTKLQEAGLKITNIRYGNKWFPFKGGEEDIRKISHYFFSFTVEES
jgi:hypothetical protein